MRRKSEFVIEFEGLKYGAHAFDWEIENLFFDQFGGIDANVAKLSVKLDLLKEAHLMVLTFQISGIEEYECDLCLKPLRYKPEIKHTLVLKHGDAEEGNIDDDIIILPENAFEFDVAPVIFELVKVSEPVKRGCEEGEPFEGCDKELMQKYLALELPESPSPSPEEEDEIDPRWEALRKLKGE